MLPEEKARVKIDKQLNNAGWDIVDINAGRKRKRLLAFC